MANLYIPVGIPGCGKSTFAQTHDHAVVLNTDLIRIELTGDINDQSRNDEVFRLFHERVEDCLFVGDDVYADATNLRPYAREKLRAIADRVRIGAYTHVYMFDNMEQAVLRNMARNRVVPPDVMIRFIAQFEQAIVDIDAESYTSITTIRNLH